MQCSNHPDVVAEVRCDGCAEPHCAACIVEVGGQKFCTSCKVIVVKDRKGPPPRPLQQGVICDEAKYALMMAVGGMTCCLLGFVLHPIAFIMAHQAVERIKYNKGLVGIEIARAAQVTAAVGLGMTLLIAALFFFLIVVAASQA